MRSTTRRQFLLVSTGSLAGAALLNAASAHGAIGIGTCSESCSTATAWMLQTDWGFPAGPKNKTALVSRASHAAAANRIARTQAEAIDMNLHLCSFAPALEIELCESRLENAFENYARDWSNPWNGTTPRIVDRRWIPDHLDPLGCPASNNAPSSSHVPTHVVGADVDTSANGLAFTGANDRRLLMLGIAATATGMALRKLARLGDALGTPPR